MKKTKSKQISYEIKTTILGRKYLHIREVVNHNDGRIILSEPELKELYNAVFKE